MAHSIAHSSSSECNLKSYEHLVYATLPLRATFGRYHATNHSDEGLDQVGPSESMENVTHNRLCLGHPFSLSTNNSVSKILSVAQGLTNDIHMLDIPLGGCMARSGLRQPAEQQAARATIYDQLLVPLEVAPARQQPAFRHPGRGGLPTRSCCRKKY